MDLDPAGGAQLICKFKPQLIDALYGDPDFLLQHCQSSSLLTMNEYSRLKACAVPSDEARDILDCMMSKDGERVQRFLSLLTKPELQETFPKLAFLKEQLPLHNTNTAGKKRTKSDEKLSEEEEDHRKQPHKTYDSRRTVTEKQLMQVARCIGKDWKEVGRMALNIPSVKLEQIVEENANSHKERVFSMLRLWSMREKDRATAIHLHELLTQNDISVAPGSIEFLLEES